MDNGKISATITRSRFDIQIIGPVYPASLVAVSRLYSIRVLAIIDIQGTVPRGPRFSLLRGLVSKVIGFERRVDKV